MFLFVVDSISTQYNTGLIIYISYIFWQYILKYIKICVGNSKREIIFENSLKKMFEAKLNNNNLEYKNRMAN